jgi:ABC-2 type transport system ATP-binding protein
MVLPVEARGLVKRFGSIVAVDQVDLTVEPGDVYGFLGPNGAGKTTAMRILLGLSRPDGGTVRLFGRDPQRELPEALDGVAGFVESPRFYGYLTGRKNLELFAAFDGGGASSRIDEMLELVGLQDRARDKVGGYSQGMKQRLGLAASLIRSPRLLVLDEPTNGLDPGGIRDMRGLIDELAARGITIFLSSHLLAEVEEICTRVSVIRSGAIVYEGSLEDLRRSSATRYRLRTTSQRAAFALISSDRRTSDASLDGDDILFGAEEADLAELSRALVAAGLGILALVPETATLESLFFELTEGDEHPHRLQAIA